MEPQIITHLHRSLPSEIAEEVRAKVERNSRGINYEVTATSGSVARTLALIDEALIGLRIVADVDVEQGE